MLFQVERANGNESDPPCPGAQRRRRGSNVWVIEIPSLGVLMDFVEATDDMVIVMMPDPNVEKGALPRLVIYDGYLE